MNKMFMAGVLCLLLIGMVSAVTAPTPYANDLAIRPYASPPKVVADSDTPVVKVKSSGGGTFITIPAWNGVECVKRDIYGSPFLSKPEAKFSKDFVILDKKAPEGKVWRAKVIPGEYGIVLNKNKIGVMKVLECDKNVMDTSPIPAGWYHMAEYK